MSRNILHNHYNFSSGFERYNAVTAPKALDDSVILFFFVISCRKISLSLFWIYWQKNCLMSRNHKCVDQWSGQWSTVTLEDVALCLTHTCLLETTSEMITFPSVAPSVGMLCMWQVSEMLLVFSSIKTLGHLHWRTSFRQFVLSWSKCEMFLYAFRIWEMNCDIGYLSLFLSLRK